MSDLRSVKPGDLIIEDYLGQLRRKRVEKILKRYVVAEDGSKYDIDSGRLWQNDGGDYRPYAKVPTAEDFEAIERKSICAIVSRDALAALSLDQLRRILAIVKEKK